MEYRFIPIVLILLMSGCKGDNHAINVAVSDNADTTYRLFRPSSSIDSVCESTFRATLKDDSVKLISVQHLKCNSYKIEFVSYMDQRCSPNIEHLNKMDKTVSNTLNGGACNLARDTFTHIRNPFADLNGIYSSVYKYKGQLIFAGGMDAELETDKVIMDSSIYTHGMTDWCLPYLGAEQKDGIVIYQLISSDKDMDKLEIKKLGGQYDLQLWKWTTAGKTEYEFRVPLREALSIPSLVSMNNLGLGACDSGIVYAAFDKINFDSLMRSK